MQAIGVQQSDPLGRRFESSSTLLCAEVRALDGSVDCAAHIENGGHHH